MAVAVKQFSYNATLEGWAFTAGGASSISGTRDTTEDSPNDTNAGTGVMQTRRTGRNSTNGTPYWEWTGTFEDLGVTAGNVVSAVNLNYDWRCSEYTTGNSSSYTGPAELRNSGGTLIGTFSTSQTFSGTTSFVQKSGTALTGLSYPSNTTVKLRIGACPKTGASTSAAVTLRQDWVQVAVVHDLPAATGRGWISSKGGWM